MRNDFGFNCIWITLNKYEIERGKKKQQHTHTLFCFLALSYFSYGFLLLSFTLFTSMNRFVTFRMNESHRWRDNNNNSSIISSNSRSFSNSSAKILCSCSCICLSHYLNCNSIGKKRCVLFHSHQTVDHYTIFNGWTENRNKKIQQKRRKRVKR